MTSLAATPVAYGSDKKNQKSDQTTLKLHRADGVAGLDVVSTDGKKVGDIVDFALQFDGSPPRISHVLVMSGGFLDMGGDVRAVPASKLSMEDGRVRIDADAKTFNNAPVIGDDRMAFFGDTARVRSLDQHFGASRSGSDQMRADRRKADKNQTAGQSTKHTYTLYSTLANNQVIGANGDDLGRITDAWINLDDARVPLIEIDPSIAATGFFETDYQQRYQLPVTRLQGKADEGAAYRFSVSSADLQDAPSVTSVDKVSIDYGASFGDSVLRLELPEKESRS